LLKVMWLPICAISTGITMADGWQYSLSLTGWKSCDYLHFNCHTEDVRDLDIIDYLEKSLKISDVNHPNVLRLIGVGFDLTGSISLVYPYMVEHDLLTFLKKNRSSDFSCKPSNVCDIASVKFPLLMTPTGCTDVITILHQCRQHYVAFTQHCHNAVTTPLIKSLYRVVV